MNRAEAIKQIELFLDMEKLGGAIEVALKMAITALREQEKREWISVSERLPEDGVRVLAACDDGVVRLGISKGGFPSVVNRAHRFADVTHWMPLPEPPEEGGQGK